MTPMTDYSGKDDLEKILIEKLRWSYEASPKCDNQQK